MVSLGTYPATSLKAARAKRAEMRTALEAGKKPAAETRCQTWRAPDKVNSHV
jgi:hypothetical protein